MGIRIWNFEFVIHNLNSGFRIAYFESRITEIRIPNCRYTNPEYRTSEFRISELWISGFRIAGFRIPEFQLPESECRILDSEFRIPNSELRMAGSPDSIFRIFKSTNFGWFRSHNQPPPWRRIFAPAYSRRGGSAAGSRRGRGKGLGEIPSRFCFRLIRHLATALSGDKNTPPHTCFQDSLSP